MRSATFKCRNTLQRSTVLVAARRSAGLLFFEGKFFSCGPGISDCIGISSLVPEQKFSICFAVCGRIRGLPIAFAFGAHSCPNVKARRRVSPRSRGASSTKCNARQFSTVTWKSSSSLARKSTKNTLAIFPFHVPFCDRLLLRSFVRPAGRPAGRPTDRPSDVQDDAIVGATPSSETRSVSNLETDARNRLTRCFFRSCSTGSGGVRSWRCAEV